MTYLFRDVFISEHIYEKSSAHEIILDLTSWNTKNVIDMNHMFDVCVSLISINL